MSRCLTARQIAEGFLGSHPQGDHTPEEQAQIDSFAAQLSRRHQTHSGGASGLRPFRACGPERCRCDIGAFIVHPASDTVQ